MSYSDGTFTSLTQDGKPLLAMPLSQDGSNAVMTERDYVILASNYSPTLPTYSITDPDNANAYLVAESTPTDKGAGLLSVTRTFHEIPSPTTVYTTIPLNKPAFPIADFEDYWADNITSEGTVNVWGIAETVTVSPYPNGGTFTVTYKTDTTGPLAYNASGATIQAAVEALPDFVTDGGVFTYCSNQIPTTGELVMTFSSVPGPGTNISVNGSSLTPAHVEDAANFAYEFRYWVARSVVNVAYPAHGQTGTFDSLFLNGTTGGGVVRECTRVDDDNFSFANASATIGVASHARLFIRTYTPGTSRVRGRNVTTYYLPGVSAGITTPEDIPLPANLANNNELLLAVCENATGYQDYDADELDVYMGEIYRQSVTQIDMADL